jgi:hypothetical protein
MFSSAYIKHNFSSILFISVSEKINKSFDEEKWLHSVPETSPECYMNVLECYSVKNSRHSHVL